jgi:hypothetical protein
MKILKGMPVVAIGLVAAVVVSVGCKKSSSSSAAAAGPTGTQAAAVSRVMNAASSVALVHAQGGVRPATAVSVACPGGGTIAVDISAVTAGIAGNTITYGGNMTVTPTNCSADGYTISGAWTEIMSFSGTFSPSINNATSMSSSGTVKINNGTITVGGTSCSVTVTDTLSDTYNITTGAFTGTFTYSGTACGVTDNGTITL